MLQRTPQHYPSTHPMSPSQCREQKEFLETVHHSASPLGSRVWAGFIVPMWSQASARRPIGKVWSVSSMVCGAGNSHIVRQAESVWKGHCGCHILRLPILMSPVDTALCIWSQDTRQASIHFHCHCAPFSLSDCYHLLYSL